jgi:hypothetical protein
VFKPFVNENCLKNERKKKPAIQKNAETDLIIRRKGAKK